MSDLGTATQRQEGRLAHLWHHMALKLKLQLLIQGCLLLILLLAQQWLSSQFEHRLMKAAEERTLSVADGVINGLNTLMEVHVNDDEVISDKRARRKFIKKMGASENITELRVIRAKSVDLEFGEGLPEERPADEIDNQVLASGKTAYQLDHRADGQVLLRATLPYVAMKLFRTSACLDCHRGKEGDVLGAVSITADIQEDLAAIRTVNRWIWLGQVGVQVVLFFVIGYIVRHLLDQLGAEPSEATRLAQNVAAGDLSTRIHTRSNDTHSMMAQLLQMQQSLIKLVGGVRRSSESVAMASAEIAQGNLDLSSRTEKQAHALEKTATGMEELGAQVKQNAANAEEANRLVVTASEVALRGGKVVGDVVTTMRGINDASRKIADIIGVIDGIAFQTNILALNAAVEASRAGEHGRGFAVVASEVRSLAGRSADAAREIKTLIAASVQKVEQGMDQVDKAGVTMNDIVQSIRRATDIMAEISQASRQQAEGVADMGQAVVEMDAATQQNAAMVEQIASAAGSLKSLADDLVHSVSVFKLSEG